MEVAGEREGEKREREGKGEEGARGTYVRRNYGGRPIGALQSAEWQEEGGGVGEWRGGRGGTAVSPHVACLISAAM